jgi:hypothetical protein
MGGVLSSSKLLRYDSNKFIGSFGEYNRIIQTGMEVERSRVTRAGIKAQWNLIIHRQRHHINDTAAAAKTTILLLRL